MQASTGPSWDFFSPPLSPWLWILATSLLNSIASAVSLIRQSSDVCGATLSMYAHRASWKVCLTVVVYQLSYEVKPVRVGDKFRNWVLFLRYQCILRYVFLRWCYVLKCGQANFSYSPEYITPIHTKNRQSKLVNKIVCIMR
jgi:hypothetical protein